jgi:hypothetical protein
MDQRIQLGTIRHNCGIKQFARQPKEGSRISGTLKMEIKEPLKYLS